MVKKTLMADAMCWLGVMLLACVIAFCLLRRDAQRNFGAVSFGSFPEFRLRASDKGYLDRHLLKGHVWAVHAGSSPAGLTSVVKRLYTIERQTASGKRHLFVLTLNCNSSFVLRPQQAFHYVTVEESKTMFSFIKLLGGFTDDTVLLVDQNAVVRGKYHFNDMQEFKNFQQDLIRIL